MKVELLSTKDKDLYEQQYGIGSLCAKVLASKNLQEEQIFDILSDAELCDPLTALHMKEVVARIKQAKDTHEKVLICGDYDADGICATTILYDACIRFGVDAGFYIPNRFKEGYGLHANTVRMAKEKGYTLLITVDNGVKALEALQLAKEEQIDVIVTDHHTMDEEFPCLYLLHPQTMGDDFQYLSGAGVALEISRALIGECKEHVVLACVASIGDVMPLWKETRTIVKKGLQYLRNGICVPIQLLSNDAYPKWDERMIAFQVVPKLNATGRLADLANTNNTVRYLLMQDKMSMIAFVKQINGLNTKRRTMSTKMSDFARSLIDPQMPFQMIYHEDFHEGLVGLVAGKLAEELHQPVMVLAGEDDLKGSIRSYGGVDLRTFFDECKTLLSAYGGHKAAAGIGFQKAHMDAIKQHIKDKMEQISIQEEEPSCPAIGCDIDDLSIQNVEELENFAPFGEGFTKPLFCIEHYPVQSIRELSGGKHVRWESLANVDALYFNAKDVYVKYQDEKEITLLGSLSINHFRGDKKVNIFVDEVIS